MHLTHEAPVHAPTSMPGWIRQCDGCGAPDVQAVYPSAAMLDRQRWNCAVCGAGRHVAVHVPADATACPVMQHGAVGAA